MGVWSSCSESLETSLCSVSAGRTFIVPLLDVRQQTVLVCRDADIYLEIKLLLVFRFCISTLCFHLLMLSYNERNYVHYALTTYAYKIFLFVTVILNCIALF